MQTKKGATHSLVRGCLICEPEDGPDSFTTAGSSGDAVDDGGSAARFGCGVLLDFPVVCKHPRAHVCKSIRRMIYSTVTSKI